MSLPPFVMHFADLADPRIARTRRHLLMEILVITFCAVLCGAEGWEYIGRLPLPPFRVETFDNTGQSASFVTRVMLRRREKPRISAPMVRVNGLVPVIRRDIGQSLL